MPYALYDQAYEIGVCGGLQNLDILDIFVPTETKCVLIGAILAVSVREINAGSFVAKVIPQFVDVEAIMAHALKHTTIGALVLDVRGVERALVVDSIYFVISASKMHNRGNVERSIDEQPDSFRAFRAVEAAISNALRRAA